VPIDLSDTARGALLVGLSWASALRAGAATARATTLAALHLDPDGSSVSANTVVERELAIVRRSAGDWVGVAVEGMLERGHDVTQVISGRALEFAADLVVLGTRGLGLSGAVRLGSVSASVVTTLLLPILLVPPAVWRVHGLDV
jgi:nucleotide-binding universal stress UspA family protein